MNVNMKVNNIFIFKYIFNKKPKYGCFLCVFYTLQYEDIRGASEVFGDQATVHVEEIVKFRG